MVDRPTSTGSDKISKDENAVTTPSLSRRAHDGLLLFAIFIMLAWPWIVFGVLWQLQGLKMNNSVAQVAMDHRHTTKFFVTFIGSVVSLVITILFSIAVIRFGQEWGAGKEDITLFHISLLSAFRYQKFPWNPFSQEDRRYILAWSRFWLVFLVIVCITIFTFVPSGVVSLIGPISFKKNFALTGTELDFSSRAPDCINWIDLNSRMIDAPDCGWKPFNGAQYTTCLGENQMVDVLGSGRGDMLTLLRQNSESLTFNQLGPGDGLHFLKPVRGVLANGPGGVPAFNTTSFSPISNVSSRREAGVTSYNYTLPLQGLRTDIKCNYKSQSPITFETIESPTTSKNMTSIPSMVHYTGTCPAGADILGAGYFSIDSNNTVGFWACNDTSPGALEESYILYIRGRDPTMGNSNLYTQSVGNITCTVSSIQFAILVVTYRSEMDAFTSGNWTATSANASSRLIQRAVIELGNVINQAQNQKSNLVADSVITVGVKGFGLAANVQDETYLRLYEEAIKGILEYEATYIRLLYSTFPDRPSSCNRIISGNGSYEVTGWSVNLENIGFLMPMTLINLAALVIALTAVFIRKGRHNFDPTNTVQLALASSTHNDNTQTRWAKTVNYRSRDVLNDTTGMPARQNVGGAAGSVIEHWQSVSG